MLLDIQFPDDATRPQGPRLDNLTPAQKLPGQHLRMIHDHLRRNMAVLRDMIDEVARGEMSAEHVSRAAETMPLVENYRQFGALCGRQCQIVHMHHSIEDEAIFPVLSAKAEAFRKVVARLVEEHEIVHELLMRLIGALQSLAQTPNSARFNDVKTLYDALERVLLSHLGYEEDAIGDALGYYDIGV